MEIVDDDLVGDDVHDVGVVPDAFHRDFFGPHSKAGDGTTVGRVVGNTISSH